MSKLEEHLGGLLNLSIFLVDVLGVATPLGNKIISRFPSRPVGMDQMLSARLYKKWKGIPINRVYSIPTEYGYLLEMPNIDTVKTVDYVIEEHVTPRNQKASISKEDLLKMRSGQKGVRTHWDLRWKDPETGEIHAVAIPQSKLPAVGERFQVLKVDDRHGHDILINDGTKIRDGHVLIESGYGRGHSKVIQTGKTFIWSGADSNFHIWIPGEGAFAIVKPQNWDKRSFLMIRKNERVPNIPRPFTPKDISSREDILQKLVDDPNYVFEHKKDGAFYTVIVTPKKGHKQPIVRVISRRAKHVNGLPTEEGIDRSYNLPQLKFADWPEEAYNKKIYVEIYSETASGYDSPFNRTAAILNSDPAKAIAEQESTGYLKASILRIDGQSNYLEERKLGSKIAKNTKSYGMVPSRSTHQYVDQPEIAFTSEEKLALVKKLKKQGAEGIVAKSLDGKETYKYIFRGPTSDMTITGIEMMNTSQEKYMRNGQVIAAQRFQVTDSDGNTRYVVIRDPEGSSDNLKLDIGQNPDRYIGKIVEIKLNRSDRESAGQIVRIREDK